MAEEDFPRGGEPHAALLAVEKLDPQGIFELGDLPRHRRGRDVEAARRLAHREVHGHGVEVEQGGLVEHAGKKTGGERVLPRAIGNGAGGHRCSGVAETAAYCSQFESIKSKCRWTKLL